MTINPLNWTCQSLLHGFSYPRSLQVLTFGILSALLTALPGVAAEKIYFRYGPMAESLKVQSLEQFAQTGEIAPDLRFYFNLANANEATIQELRKALVKRADINPFLLSQFFYSQLGYDILGRLGYVIQTPAWHNGRTALRAGLILAASDSDGLTLLNFLKKLPVNININLPTALSAYQSLERIMRATEFFTKKMAVFSSQEAKAAASVDFTKLPDLRQIGPLGAQEQRWVLKDTNRNRQFYVLVVQPQQPRSNKTPVVIMSHGLGSRPEDFVDQAKHLASHGFLVMLPQHPGSDTQQVEDLKRGLSQHFFLNSEFIDRPRDVSYVIDELERRNQSEFGGRLDLQSVGVAGHSFGGYTALALAGAKINFDFLQQQCDAPFGHLNTSMLLQCRALQLSREDYRFQDPRVKAIYIANPVMHSIFGAQGLEQVKIPVFVVGGSDDPATPVVLEQARSFPLLGSQIKYLALAEGQAHVNLAQLDIGITKTLDSIQGLALASPELLESYTNATVLAFFETYIAGNAAYQPYMQSAYTNYLSQDQKFKIYMISAASEKAFNAAAEEFRSQR